jgi:hypothetical protein
MKSLEYFTSNTADWLALSTRLNMQILRPEMQLGHVDWTGSFIFEEVVDAGIAKSIGISNASA